MTIVPISRPPSIFALMIPTTIGNAIGTSAGSIMLRIADFVTMSIARPYSGRDVPSMMPGVLAELAAHLLDDLAADAADRLHRERREQERHQAADEQAGDHPRVREVEGERAERAVARALRVEPVGVRAEEDERGERGRADRVALRDGLRRVADRVERIGDRRAPPAAGPPSRRCRPRCR